MKEDLAFRQHFQDFFGETGSKLRKPRDRSRARSPLDKTQKDEENMLEQDKTRFDRGATPGRTLIQCNLKPAPPRNTDVFELNTEPKCDLKQHFKEFMSTTNKKDSSVARARLVYFENDKIIRGVVFKQFFCSHMCTMVRQARQLPYINFQMRYPISTDYAQLLAAWP